MQRSAHEHRRDLIYLLDAHVLIWAIYSPHLLSALVRKVLEEPSNVLLVSDASLWKTCNKVGRGKLRLTEDNIFAVREKIDALGVTYVAINRSHILAAASLPRHHSDPFDRILVAQAIALDVPLVTMDRALRQYDLEIIW